MVDQPESQQRKPTAEPVPAPPMMPRACPQCSEPYEADARFCEECGYQLDGSGGPAAPRQDVEQQAERSIVWWLIVVVWVILGVGGLVWLFARAILL